VLTRRCCKTRLMPSAFNSRLQRAHVQGRNATLKLLALPAPSGTGWAGSGPFRMACVHGIRRLKAQTCRSG
jgi:hypothetical protein